MSVNLSKENQTTGNYQAEGTRKKALVRSKHKKHLAAGRIKVNIVAVLGTTGSRGSIHLQSSVEYPRGAPLPLSSFLAAGGEGSSLLLSWAK